MTRLAYLVTVLLAAVMYATLPASHIVLAAAWHAIDPTRLPATWAAVVFLILAVTSSIAWHLGHGRKLEDGGMR